MPPITGILLAAGASSRYGSDKLMQPMTDGKPLAVHACQNLAAGCDKVIAVLRPGSLDLAELLRKAGSEPVFCPDAAQGMGHSLAFGIRATPEAAGWLIALADMPLIAPATIQAIAAAIRAGKPLAAPVYQGRRGHPVGFGQQLRDELSQLSGDSGAKSVLQSYREQLCLIDCDDPGILRDIDRPEDLITPSP